MKLVIEVNNMDLLWKGQSKEISNEEFLKTLSLDHKSRVINLVNDRLVMCCEGNEVGIQSASSGDFKVYFE